MVDNTNSCSSGTGGSGIKGWLKNVICSISRCDISGSGSGTTSTCSSVPFNKSRWGGPPREPRPLYLS